MLWFFYSSINFAGQKPCRVEQNLLRSRSTGGFAIPSTNDCVLPCSETVEPVLSLIHDKEMLMSWSEAKCPVCGNEIFVPTDEEKYRCPRCSQEIYIRAALAFGAAAEPKEPDKSLAEVREQAVEGQCSAAPFLDSWKTSVGMFLLGFLCSFALSSATFLGTPAYLAVAAAFTIGLLYWMFGGYPSLFTSKPHLKSSGAVSFLNGFFGGIVFGALWCTCLTKRKKGISQYVLTALLLVVVAAGVAAGFGVFGSPIPQGSVEGASSRVESSVSANNAGQSDASRSDGNSNANELSDVVYADPASLCSTNEAREILRKGRLQQPYLWDSLDPVQQRISFGDVDTESDSWFLELSGTTNEDVRPLAETTMRELESIATAQMFGGASKRNKAYVGSQAFPSEEEQLADDSKITFKKIRNRFGSYAIDLENRYYKADGRWWESSLGYMKVDESKAGNEKDGYPDEPTCTLKIREVNEEYARSSISS